MATCLVYEVFFLCFFLLLLESNTISDAIRLWLPMTLFGSITIFCGMESIPCSVPAHSPQSTLFRSITMFCGTESLDVVVTLL